MEIIIDNNTLEEIDYIINNFTKAFADKVTDISAIAFCLQSLLDAKEKLEKEINNEKSIQ